jgi:uncharacterized membrane protein YjjP (DUF1212 family)
MECGCSSNRLERLLTQLGNTWNFSVESLALPTGVSIMVAKDGRQALSLIRVRRWQIDLDKLQKISEMVEKISHLDIDLLGAKNALQEIMKAPPPYNIAVSVMAGAGSSAGLVYLYGGPWQEILLTLGIGLLVTILQKFVFVAENRRYLADFLSAFIVALVAGLTSRVISEINVSRVITGGVVGMVPGLTLLNAIHEIAQKNLVSGSAKSVEAFVVGLSLSFGVAAAFSALKYF